MKAITISGWPFIDIVKMSADPDDELDSEDESSVDHDCGLDEWGTGACDHPSHQFELVDQRPQTESEAYQLAH